MRGINIHPVILAAGPSTLGIPKALARFGECTAVEIAVANCADLRPPLVVLGSQGARVRRALPAGVKVVINRGWRRGQLSSLRLALRRLPQDADFMLYPVDYPLLTPALVAQVVRGFARRAGNEQIVVPRFRGRGGHPVIFSASLRRELLTAATAREVVYRDPGRVKFVAVRSEAIWRDLDSPAAYRAGLREFRRRNGAA